MSVERVRAFLSPLGLAERMREFDVSSATVPLAALALGTQEARIAKTLSLRRADGGAMVIVLAGDARLHNPKFKARFHTKARMLSAGEAAGETGFRVGGVCPFALPENVEVYLDESLRRFATVFPSCGSASSAIELSPTELEAASGGTWVDVGSLITNE